MPKGQSKIEEWVFYIQTKILITGILKQVEIYLEVKIKIQHMTRIKSKSVIDAFPQGTYKENKGD